MTTTTTGPAAVTSLSSKHPAYRKRWQLDRARGMTRMVDPAPAVAHVRALLGAGVTKRGIAEAASCSPTVLCRLLEGQPTMRREVAARILAVSIDRVVNRDRARGFVPAAGSRRRVQALLAIGWRHEDLNGWLRTHRPQVRQWSQLILSQAGDLLERRTADAVRDLYDALWSTPGPSDLTRHRARRLGYAPPLAWDDDTIDDPAARPAGVEGSMQSRRARLVEDVEELVGQGATVDAACIRLGKHRSNLQRTLQRAGRHDLWRALTGTDLVIGDGARREVSA